jgi:shikimate dehydrogenase
VTLPLCFGVLGDPVAHSRSPAMHAAAFAVLGLPHRYLAFHVPSARLAPALAGARALGFGGLNLTLPHKQAALPAMDGLGAAARRIGAVNTVCFTAAGMVGHNTDGQGFAAAARELDATPLRSALVLGAGGAALAVVDALVLRGAAGRAGGRWGERASRRRWPRCWRGGRELRGRVVLGSYAVGGADGRRRWRAELLVNCTSVGMVSGPSELPGAAGGWRRWRPRARVIDAVYPRPAGRPARPGGGAGAAGAGRAADAAVAGGAGARAVARRARCRLDVVAAMRAALS